MPELSTFLDGVQVGAFAMSTSGAVTFTYDEQYRSNGAAMTPLSLALRPSRASWGARAAGPFLAGLLPDSPARLDTLAAQYHVPAHPFRLLERIGSDAAGAVQLLPVGEAASDAARRTGDVAPLSDDDLDDLLTALARDPGPWGGVANRGRWSLAGAQSKVALFRFDDGSWGSPLDSTPTTHILKPASEALPDHDVNEFLSMDAARRLGLEVADHELMRSPSGRRVFVSARYDRRHDEAGRWSRLHQEDLCQALSVYPDRKYQEDGGPSPKQIAGLLRASIAQPQERRRAQTSFFDALVFNTAMSGTDAHAKNYSVLLEGDTVRMAPLYDLASHAVYGASDENALRGAMAIGGEYRFAAIGERQFVDVARSLDLSPDEAVDRYRSITSRVADAFADAARALDEPFATTLADAVAANAGRRGWTTR